MDEDGAPYLGEAQCTECDCVWMVFSPCGVDVTEIIPCPECGQVTGIFF